MASCLPTRRAWLPFQRCRPTFTEPRRRERRDHREPLMQVFNVDTFHGTPVATKRSSVASIEKKVTHLISCKVREAALAGWLARPCARQQMFISRSRRQFGHVFLRRGLPEAEQLSTRGPNAKAPPTCLHTTTTRAHPPSHSQSTKPLLEQRGVSASTRLYTHGFSKDVGQISFASDGLLRPGS